MSWGNKIHQICKELTIYQFCNNLYTQYHAIFQHFYSLTYYTLFHLFVRFVCPTKILGHKVEGFWYVDYSHKYKIYQGDIVGGRQPLVEEPLVKDNLLWKTAFGANIEPNFE